MQVVKICESQFEANLVKGRLENEGIRAEIINENINRVLPQFSTTISMKVQVVVADEDAAKAYELLEDTSNNLITTCPQCGSSNIDFSLGTHKWKKIFAFVLAAISVSPLGGIRRGYTCKDCNSKF